MLGALYLIGVPVFAFLAWVFSVATHDGKLDDRHSRRLISVLLGLWAVATFSRARRLQRADRSPP